MPHRHFHKRHMESAKYYLNQLRITADPIAAIIKPDREVQFSRVSVIEHLNLGTF